MPRKQTVIHGEALQTTVPTLHYAIYQFFNRHQFSLHSEKNIDTELTPARRDI
jgi:hypothetical protein